MKLKLLFAGIAAVFLVSGLSGCADSESPTMTVNLSGTIGVPADVQGSGKTVTVSLYHAWALDGELRHPIEFIESFATTLGDYDHAFEYPLDGGEGLLVYAWVDSDGDRVHCTPTVRIDRAGLIEVASFPAADVVADIILDTPCAGPDWFYPPAVNE